MAARSPNGQLFPPGTAGRDRTRRMRLILLALVAGYYFDKTFKRQIFPWGRPVAWKGRHNFSKMDPTNDLLQATHGRVQKIFQRVTDKTEGLIKGTETIVVDKQGHIFGMTEEAELIQFSDIQATADGLTSTAQVTFVKDLGVGRPLGGEFSKDGQTLWIADAILGLTRLKNPMDPKSKVELVADTVTLQDGTKSQLLYVDDVAIGPQSGKIYFTDASTVVPTRVETQTWDTLYGMFGGRYGVCVCWDVML